jgi:hypothetical protein
MCALDASAPWRGREGLVQVGCETEEERDKAGAASALDGP